MANAIPEGTDDVAERIALRTLAARGPDYSAEVRRLLDAGREVMRRCGTGSRPRVADIVAEAELSNDAFYRHFPSKDALVAAILADGTHRLRSYLAHQMSKADGPEGRVRRWLEGLMAQATNEEVAATTLAVWWNAGGLTTPVTTEGPTASAPLATLLEQPLADLGSPAPELDASLVAHAAVGRLSDHLRDRTRPDRHEIDHLLAFTVAAAGATVEPTGRRPAEPTERPGRRP